MFFVYFLRSVNNPDKTYIGFTTNIQQRLDTHNSGGSIYTKDFRPWYLVTYIAFDDESKAKAFEKYVKVGSGNAWSKKHLW